MPLWLQILLPILTFIVGLVSTFGFSAYFVKRFEHKAKLKNDAEDQEIAEAKTKEEKLAEVEKQEYMNELKEVISEMLKNELQSVIKDVVINDLKPVVKEVVEEVVADKLKPYDDAVKQFSEDIKLIKTGLQCCCRNDLDDIADKAEDQGYASKYNKDRFEQTYNTYHNLGANGVMDATREKLHKLPDHQPRKRSSVKAKKVGSK